MSTVSQTHADDAKAALCEFLIFLESQPSRIVSRLVRYTHGEVQFHFGQLANLLESGEFMNYMQESSDRGQPDELESEFQVFYDLYLLRDLLIKTPLPELMLLLSVVHSDNLAHRISRVDGVHGVLTQLGPAAITEIHTALIQPADDQQVLIDRLRDYLSLDDQHYHLYQTLVNLFCQDKTQLTIIANTLAFINTTQLALLPRLSPLEAEDLQDIINIFNPATHITTGVTVDLGDVATHDESASSFNLVVTEQPPDRCVYKRNVKPGPVVAVHGGTDDELESNIWMAAILTRCDTEEDVPTFLTGNAPQRLTPSRTFEWKRLKVMVTSHQQNETMFALRFELRRYPDGYTAEDATAPFDVLAFASTNPILVLSHSTQLRVPVEALPNVVEVVPASGPVSGFTRVAVLGKDFVESPTTRVRFGTTEVHPIFHGPKTLICRTPQHVSGRVEVRVCNDVNGWSTTCGHFYFDPHQKEPSVQSPGGMVAFETGFETARVVQHR